MWKETTVRKISERLEGYFQSWSMVRLLLHRANTKSVSGSMQRNQLAAISFRYSKHFYHFGCIWTFGLLQ